MGRAGATALRVLLAAAALEAGEVAAARQMLAGPRAQLQRCCADTLAAANADFVHARILWRESEHRAEALEIARRTQALYQQRGVKQSNVTGLVSQWLAAHDGDALGAGSRRPQ